MENVQEKSLFDDLVSFDEPIEIETDEQVEIDRSEDIDSSDVQSDEIEDREDDTDETVESVSEDNEEETDGRVEALYELLIENRVIAKQNDFKPTLDNLQGVLENLPEQYFLKAAEELHPDAREIAKALFYLGENATKEEIVKMLDSTDYTPTVNLDDEDSAYNYLESRLKDTKGFKDKAYLTKYLNTLKDEDTLVDAAKQLYNEELQEAEQSKQSKLEQLKQQKVQREQQVKQFYQSITDELNTLPWQQDKKKQVIEYLQPNNVERINSMIQTSPKAIIQLADIYSRFNVDTKEFDLSDFELKTDSKKNNMMKDNAKKAKLDSILSKVKSGKSNSGDSSPKGFFSQFEKTN